MRASYTFAATAAAAILASCTEVVSVTNLETHQVTEPLALSPRVSGYEDTQYTIGPTSYWDHFGIEEAVIVSFRTKEDLTALARRKSIPIVSAFVVPCEDGRSYARDRYMADIVEKSDDGVYRIELPHPLRKVMDNQKRGQVVAYEEWGKDAIATDRAEDLCLIFGGTNMTTIPRIHGTIGSLAELGIPLD